MDANMRLRCSPPSLQIIRSVRSAEVIEQDLCSLRCLQFTAVPGRNRQFSDLSLGLQPWDLSLGPQPSWAARSSFLFDFRTVAGATIFSRISAQVLRTSAVTSE